MLILNTTKATAYRLRLATFSRNEVKEMGEDEQCRGYFIYIQQNNIMEESTRELLTIVKALRQLAKTTLLVEFRVMQFTIDLQHKQVA